MKKYDIQLLINPQLTKSYWKGLNSDSTPKLLNDGVMQIDDRYFNAINVDELIIVENHQP